MQIKTDPESLDPLEVRSVMGMTVSRMLYDGLTRIDADGKPILSIADGLDISPDRLTYTFHLRESHWTDGTPVTANQFVAGWERALSPEKGYPCAFLLYAIKNARAPGAHTLIVTLKKPTPYFLELLATPIASPLPPAEGVSNGPFQLKRMTPSSELYLTKNANYWDAEAVNLDAIQLLVVPDGMTALHMFQKGELDWMGSPMANVPVEHVAGLKEEGVLHSYPTAAVLWYKLNTRRPPLDNPKMRQALAYAIDRQAIIDYVVPLGQTPATGPIPLAVGLRDAPLFQDGNTDLARTLFEEALDEMGMTRKELPSITLTIGNNERYRTIAQAIQEQWRQVLSIHIAIQSTDFKIVLSNMSAGDYDIGGKIWFADFSDATSFLDIYKAADGRMNETGWESPRFARLLEMAETELDPALRAAYLREAEELFVSEMPVIPIYYEASCYVNREIAGVALPPGASADFKWAVHN